MKRRPWQAAFAIGVLLAVGTLRADFPKPAGAINDFVGVLTTAAEQELVGLVQGVEDATTAEIAVAIVVSLDGMSVEEYANRLFAEWGVGQQGKDNGVLILVAPTEREMRIEVGYGLEGVLPDGLAGDVIRTEFLPRFSEGDYGGGILAGTRRVAEIVTRNRVLTADERAAIDARNAEADTPPFWIIVPFLSIFVGIGFGMLGAGAGAQAIGPILFGAFFGGLPMVMSIVATNATGRVALVGVALVALIAGIRLGRKPANRVSLRGRRQGSSGGWVFGGTSGSSSGGSGSSGSSSSFGGGSSGGGGASGRW